MHSRHGQGTFSDNFPEKTLIGGKSPSKTVDEMFLTFILGLLDFASAKRSLVRTSFYIARIDIHVRHRILNVGHRAGINKGNFPQLTAASRLQ